MFLRRVGIDLGTTNILFYVPGRGIVVNEPAVAALDATDNKIMALGKEAKEMLGRTPESIIASHPLREGVIANFRITQQIIRYFLDKISGRVRLIKPDVMVAVPAGVTSTERRAVIDACMQAGAKETYIIKEPLAAALGAGIPIASSSGNMIIDIGGGSTEVAVIALGDIVASSSVRVAGDKIDEAIGDHIRKKYKLIIGEQTAEDIKIKIGSVLTPKKDLSMEVSGSNTISGLPESVMINSSDIAEAAKEPMADILSAVKSVLQKTPPELASDVMDKGMVITGGGAMLRNVDQLLTKITGVPCQTAEEPILCVAKGTGIAVENLEAFRKSVLWAR